MNNTQAIDILAESKHVLLDHLSKFHVAKRTDTVDSFRFLIADWRYVGWTGYNWWYDVHTCTTIPCPATEPGQEPGKLLKPPVATLLLDVNVLAVKSWDDLNAQLEYICT